MAKRKGQSAAFLKRLRKRYRLGEFSKKRTKRRQSQSSKLKNFKRNLSYPGGIKVINTRLGLPTIDGSGRATLNPFRLA